MLNVTGNEAGPLGARVVSLSVLNRGLHAYISHSVLVVSLRGLVHLDGQRVLSPAYRVCFNSSYPAYHTFVLTTYTSPGLPALLGHDHLLPSRSSSSRRNAHPYAISPRRYRRCFTIKARLYSELSTLRAAAGTNAIFSLYSLRICTTQELYNPNAYHVPATMHALGNLRSRSLHRL